jgi:hypothetical protein
MTREHKLKRSDAKSHQAKLERKTKTVGKPTKAKKKKVAK